MKKPSSKPRKKHPKPARLHSASHAKRRNDTAKIETTPPGDAIHRYLAIHAYHRSVSDAEKIVLGLLHKVSPGSTNRHWKRSKEISVKRNGNEIGAKKGFKEFVLEARQTGTVATLRGLLDLQDPFFGGRHSIAVSENLNPGITWGGYRSELRGPASYHLVEIEFASDILHYRRETCRASSMSEFTSLGRAYRGYLFSSVALIEAFLNVDVAFRKFRGLLHDDEESDWIRSSLEHRVEIWVGRNCPPDSIDLIKGSDAWREFKELRVARNEVTHSANPFFGISVRELHHKLNLVRGGVGGLLRHLRTLQGLDVLGFIERLESAPVASFVSASRRKRKGTPVDNDGDT